MHSSACIRSARSESAECPSAGTHDNWQEPIPYAESYIRSGHSRTESEDRTAAPACLVARRPAKAAARSRLGAAALIDRGINQADLRIRHRTNRRAKVTNDDTAVRACAGLSDRSGRDAPRASRWRASGRRRQREVRRVPTCRPAPRTAPSRPTARRQTDRDRHSR